MSKARCLSSDIITALPQTIIETILCLLPIEEAARTSILSRDWRYKWTKIPKLVFCYSTVPQRTIENMETSYIDRKRKYMERKRKLFYAIHQVLLLHQAPILEFTLSTGVDRGCFEVDQILLHLSRNHTVKKLTLESNDSGYKLPLCLFSLHHLTDLYLYNCYLDHQLKFTGFGNLRCLNFKLVVISAKVLLHLLSNCPSLKSLSLLLREEDLVDECSTIIELFDCLHVVEHMTTWAQTFRWLMLDPVPKKHPASLIHLKYFCYKEMRFSDEDELAFLAVLIKCSPNLEKIRVEINTDECYEIPSGILEEYSDVWLEHLNELEIDCFSNLKSEMEFVKFILARSPKLKKVSIFSVVESDQKQLEMLKVLLRAPRASPVEIVVV